MHRPASLDPANTPWASKRSPNRATCDGSSSAPIGRLPRSAPVTARGWLAALEAVALGYLHDRDALRALDDATRYAEAATGTEPAWPWVFRFGAPKIASYRAVTAARLGFPRIAAEAFEQAETAWSPKQAALVAVEHARALAIAGNLDQACALAVTAYDIGCNYESERVRQAVREFRSGLNSRNEHRVTVELDERLHSAYKPRTS